MKSQPPFQIAKDEQDPDELRRKIEEKEAQAAERRAAELAKREEVLKQQEEHAKQVKARRLNADEVAMDGTDGVRRSARKIDAAPIAEEEESEAGDA